MKWRTPAGAALTHARRGWVMVPLRPGTGLPARKWGHLTSTPPGAVAACWPGPQFNPGIATGPSSLVVVDLDSPEHGGTLPPEWADSCVTHGSDVLAILAGRAGQPVPVTYEVRTPRHGIHLYFRPPPGLVIGNSAGRVGPWIDVRGLGGLVVGAGSIRDGKPYLVADDRDPIPLPGWLTELAIKQQIGRGAVTGSSNLAAPVIPGHGYAAAALRSEVAILLGTARGRRNHQLNKSAFSLGTLVGSGDLDQADVTVALMDAAEAIGLIADDGHDQAERTIASGLSAGVERPRTRRAA